jgi:glycosyltransferase involved in cell wall biosynthesis
MKSSSIVSVIVPTKNSEATLKKCLESIKKQSYPSIEIIVVDNFSTDSTGLIAKKYADKFYTRGPERCTQRNIGVSKSSGKYVAIIDSDMYLSPSVIQESIDAINVKGVSGVVIPEKSIGIGFWAKCKSLERSFYIGVPYMEAARVFTKDTYNEVGGYDESMISGEDWDLSQRVAVLGSITSINAIIEHDEGKISLLKTVKKKYYYASHFKKYVNKTSNSQSTKKQTSILRRYALFFSKPSLIIKTPIIFIGMIFMKTNEFLFGGIGLIVSGIRAQDKE